MRKEHHITNTYSEALTILNRHGLYAEANGNGPRSLYIYTKTQQGDVPAKTRVGTLFKRQISVRLKGYTVERGHFLLRPSNNANILEIQDRLTEDIEDTRTASRS